MYNSTVRIKIKQNELNKAVNRLLNATGVAYDKLEQQIKELLKKDYNIEEAISIIVSSKRELDNEIYIKNV